MKFKLVILLFFLIVGAGTSAVLAQFNRMVYPAGPFSAFKVEYGGPGLYQVEFLGEKSFLKQPPRIAGLGNGEAAGHGVTLLRGLFNDAEKCGRQAFDQIAAKFYIFFTDFKLFIQKKQEKQGDLK